MTKLRQQFSQLYSIIIVPNQQTQNFFDPARASNQYSSQITQHQTTTATMPQPQATWGTLDFRAALKRKYTED